MLRRCGFAALSLALAGIASGAEMTDSLTGLPLPDAASGITMGRPMALDPGAVCKSIWTDNFYSPSGAKISAVIAWYSAHLKGFHRVHGYGSGRSQDAFVNADGTLMIGVTGGPAADGVDTDIYAVGYSTVKPGMSDKEVKGMLAQHLSC
jgi:hypothetical protein